MERALTTETVDKVGDKVTVKGWVHARRDHGRLVFIDLRDRAGLLQIVFWGGGDEQLFKQAEGLRSEFVIAVEGTVQKRQENQINPDLPTGTVELAAEKLEVLSEAETPPFEIADANAPEAGEEVRLKYRYLDLRRDKMQKNIRLRSAFIQKAREYLFGKDFTEIETPILTESTPEGSRDFVVPSRLNPGCFYALPQSPQQYKQLLMIGGFERYFQIARAIRDEDPRADRGFEHTQIDIEMSFVDQDDVMNTVEEMMVQTVESLGYKVKEKPFPRFTYAEAMEKFGADKFDLRSDEEKKDPKLLAYAWVYKFPFFEKNDEPFLLHNVDVVSTIDLRKMIELHNRHQALATLAVQDRKTSRYLLFDESDQLCGRRAGEEGPPEFSKAAEAVQALAFAGIHVIAPRIFRRLTEDGVFPIIPSYLRLAGEGANITAFHADEYYWRDLGRPESVAKAAGEMRQMGILN